MRNDGKTQVRADKHSLRVALSVVLLRVHSSSFFMCACARFFTNPIWLTTGVPNRWYACHSSRWYESNFQFFTKT